MSEIHHCAILIRGLVSRHDQQPATLAYSNPQDEQLWVEGRLASWHQRFDAGVIDWVLLWLFLPGVTYVVNLLIDSELTAVAAALAWMSAPVVLDVVNGWSVGRAANGLMIRGADGTFPTRRQLLMRGLVQRLWYLPVLTQFGFYLLDQSAGVRVPGDLVAFIAILIIVSGVWWFVTVVVTRRDGTTLADRMSDTRVVVNQ
jgi:hypothetical protein